METSALNVVVPTEIKNNAKMCALKLGISLKEFVIKSLEEKTMREKDGTDTKNS